MPRSRPALLALTLPMLLMLLSACSSTPKALPVPAPLIPPLSPAARQPDVPAWCLPTCSAGWKRMVESLLPRPTGVESPGLPASGDTTR